MDVAGGSDRRLFVGTPAMEEEEEEEETESAAFAGNEDAVALAGDLDEDPTSATPPPDAKGEASFELES